MRYRLYGSILKGLKVEVLYRDSHVAKSPYTLQGTYISQWLTDYLNESRLV
jgi:hypothetical protein